MERPRSRSKLASAAGLAVLLAGGLAACSSPGERGQPEHLSAIVAQNRHLEAQFRAGNLLGIADVYADDAVRLDERGERTTGREELDAYWSAIESPVEWRLEIRALHGSEALAYELARSTLITRRDGALHTETADLLLLWRREPDGQWRIELDAHWPRP